MAAELPILKEIEHLSPRVVRILGGNPGKVLKHMYRLEIKMLNEFQFTLQGTNTYLVGTGNSRLLIDTGQGEASWTNALSSVLCDDKLTISDALITHWHHDHTLGVPRLLSLCPMVRIHRYHPESPSDVPISHGQTYQTEGASLRAVHCPGHTADHVAFVLEEEDSMFTGDMVLGHSTAVFEDLGTYLSSLVSMKGEFTGRAYPGHGAVVQKGPAKIEEYLRHRAMREAEVLRALGGAEIAPGLSPEEIVKIVYKDIPRNLHEAARGGVVQVLTKLEREGRVRVVGNRERFEVIKSGKTSL